MRAPTSATIGERTAGMAGALYVPTSSESNEALPRNLGPRPGPCRSGVRSGPEARVISVGRAAPDPSDIPSWPGLAETSLRARRVACVGRVSRDARRERKSKSNGDRKNETTERHEWVLPTPPANFVAGPVNATIAAIQVEVKAGLLLINRQWRGELGGGRGDCRRLGPRAAACDRVERDGHYDEGRPGDHAPGDVLAERQRPDQQGLRGDHDLRQGHRRGTQPPREPQLQHQPNA